MKFVLCILFLMISINALAKQTPGIDYRKITTDNQQIIHVLTVDPKLINIKLVRAKDFKSSRETVVDIARHYNAIAAINGGFFRVNEYGEGLPAGLLKVDHQLYGIAYKPRAAIGWDSQTNITLMDRVQTKTTLNSDAHKLSINAMNSPFAAKQAILSSDSYDRENVTFETNATHFIINNNKIIDIQAQHFITMPKNGYIYSVGADITHTLPTLNIGDPLTINAKIIPILAPDTIETWATMPAVLSGAPLLLKDGLKLTDYSAEVLRDNFLNIPYARTSVGILPNGNWLLVVTEENITHGSFGLTIPELATTMQKLGCNNALNLDGGGSATMYYNNKLINHPMGEADESVGFATIRKVSDAIVLLPKN